MEALVHLAPALGDEVSFGEGNVLDPVTIVLGAAKHYDDCVSASVVSDVAFSSLQLTVIIPNQDIQKLGPSRCLGNFY